MVALPLFRRLGTQPQELGRGALTDVNGGSGCDRKDENVLEDVKLAENFILKEFSEMFHNIERGKDKML